MAILQTRIQYSIASAPYARVLFPISAVTFLLLAALLLGAGVHGYFIESYRSASVIPLSAWEAISTFGDERVLFALLLPFSLRYRKVVWPIILAALIGWLLAYGLKHLLHTPRPGQFFSVDPLLTQSEHMGHFSTPSNHAVMVFAFVGVWITVLSRRWVVPLLLFASTVAFSRVAIGAHWPVDVIAGALLGCIAAYLGICLSQVWRWGETQRNHLIIVTLIGISAMTLPFIDTSFPQSFWLRIVISVVALGAVVTVYGIPLLKQFKARKQT